MCDKQSYREQGYKPRSAEELWAASPMNPENKKKTFHEIMTEKFQTHKTIKEQHPDWDWAENIPNATPINTENKKKKRGTKEMEFLQEHVR